MALPKPLYVAPGSELARRIKDAAETSDPMLVDAGGSLYSLYVAAHGAGSLPPATLAAGREARRTTQLRERTAAFFRGQPGLDTLAREQGVRVNATFDELKGDFWPDGEPVDEFIATIRHWRREGGRR